MMVVVEEVIGGEMLHYLEVNGVLHHLTNLHKGRNMAVVPHKVLLFFFV